MSNCGFYKVGNKVILNKITAILEAENTHQFPYFNFHDEIYSQFDWSKEPTETLGQLYAARAWELRNKYDHLILQFSGGGDSANIMETFINNKIPLDEVLIRGAHSASEKNFNNTSAKNFFAENYLNAYPLAVYIKNNFYPDLKITVVDTVDYTIKWFEKNKNWHEDHNFVVFTPGIAWRSDCNNIDQSFQERAEKGVKQAHILGLEKPLMSYENGTYQVKFLDQYCNNLLYPSLNQPDLPYNIEAFYWGESTAPMIIKQAHAIKNYIKNNRLSPDVLKRRGRAYHDWLANIIYRRTLPVFYQAEKNSFNSFETDEFFFRDPGKHVKNFLTGVKWLTDPIPDKWKTVTPHGITLTGIWSKSYNIDP